MSKTNSLLAWARRWRWPQLVLDEGTGTVIRAGEQSWRAFASQRDRTGKRQARERIQRWEEIAIVADSEQSEQRTA